MVRDLVETSIRMVKQEKLATVEDKAKIIADEKIVELLAPYPLQEKQPRNPLEMLFGTTKTSEPHDAAQEQRTRRVEFEREILREKLARGELENETLEIEVEDNKPPMLEVFTGSGMEEMGINLQDMLGGLIPKKSNHREVTVKEARIILAQQEAQKLIDMDSYFHGDQEEQKEEGIIFWMKLIKLRAKKDRDRMYQRRVQRDILPIVEGSTVVTKYGQLKPTISFYRGRSFPHIKTL